MEPERRSDGPPVNASGTPANTSGTPVNKSGTPANTSLRKALIALGKLLLTVAATWMILRGAGMGVAQAWTVDWSLLEPDIPYLALSLLLLCADFAAGGWFWTRMLPEFGETGLPIGRGAAIQLVANLGRYVPGKVAQMVGLALLSRRAGLSAVKATSAAVTVQIVALLAACVVGAPAVIGGSAGQGDPRIQWLALAVFATLLAFLWFGGAGAIVRWILRRLGDAEDLPQGGGRRLLIWLPPHVLAWAVRGAALVFLARGLGMTIPFAAAIPAFAAAYLAGYVMIFAPAGIGVREASLAALLAHALGPEAGWALAIMHRAWLTAAEFVGALAGAGLLRRRGIL